MLPLENAACQGFEREHARCKQCVFHMSVTYTHADVLYDANNKNYLQRRKLRLRHNSMLQLGKCKLTQTKYIQRDLCICFCYTIPSFITAHTVGTNKDTKQKSSRMTSLQRTKLLLQPISTKLLLQPISTKQHYKAGSKAQFANGVRVKPYDVNV